MKMIFESIRYYIIYKNQKTSLSHNLGMFLYFNDSLQVNNQ